MNEEKQADASEEMTPEEREMMAALDADEGGTDSLEKEEDSAEKNGDASLEVSPVDMPEIKAEARAKPDRDQNLKMIMDIPVEVKVELGSSRLTIREILTLSQGAIVELDRAAGCAADIIVNGTMVGQGDVVVVNDSYGIRITKLVDAQERLDSL